LLDGAKQFLVEDDTGLHDGSVRDSEPRSEPIAIHCGSDVMQKMLHHGRADIVSCNSQKMIPGIHVELFAGF
jgi:hypothetical protein